MSDEQCTEIFAAICGSLDDVEQGRSNFEHIHYALTREDGTEEIIHVIIIKTPPYKDEDEQSENEEQH